MTVEINEKELQEIHRWYDAAAGESATCSDTTAGRLLLKGLLEKLGFEMHCMDSEEE